MMDRNVFAGPRLRPVLLLSPRNRRGSNQFAQRAAAAPQPASFGQAGRDFPKVRQRGEWYDSDPAFPKNTGKVIVY